MSTNIFSYSSNGRKTNDMCNSNWTFTDGKVINESMVSDFVRNLFTSHDDLHYGRKIEGVTPPPTPAQCQAPSECNFEYVVCMVEPLNDICGISSTNINLSGKECTSACAPVFTEFYNLCSEITGLDTLFVDFYEKCQATSQKHMLI